MAKIAGKFTHWIGSPASIALHTVFFVGIFALRWLGWPLDSILLVLTTLVSLEAIYLAIFIQMTVNRNTQSLQGVEEDIEELSEEVEDIGEGITELSEDVEEISEDVGEIQEVEEDARRDLSTRTAIDNIEANLQRLATEIENLKQSMRK